MDYFTTGPASNSSAGSPTKNRLAFSGLVSVTHASRIAPSFPHGLSDRCGLAAKDRQISDIVDRDQFQTNYAEDVGRNADLRSCDFIFLEVCAVEGKSCPRRNGSPHSSVYPDTAPEPR